MDLPAEVPRLTPTPEQEARREIDLALQRAGWIVQDRKALNLHAGPGVAVREFPLAGGGYADYLLYVDGKAAGVVEAKKAGTTLTGVESQTARYGEGLPDDVPRHVFPLPFLYQTTGVETRFTNLLDPEPASRRVFSFHRPETMRAWLEEPPILGDAAEVDPAVPGTLRGRIHRMPPVDERGMRAIQVRAVRSLEASMGAGRRRALVQMVMGAGKTYMAITSAYRLLKFGRARRVLFLVDRINLGAQALKEFQSYRTPDDGRLFTELYNVQLLTSNKIDPVAKVVITTIQRLHSMLKGEESFDETLEGSSLFDREGAVPEASVEVAYQPKLPPESFDVVFIDECHRSIYTIWRGVVAYWDAYLTGLTATPSKQTFGFFERNLVTEYTHEQAVADGVNVDFGVYAIRTAITQGGGTIPAGLYVDKRNRLTRARRWERLDEDFTYHAAQLDRDVVVEDQIRTVVQTFRDNVLTGIFPGRKEVPKTLIFAKSDSHADDIVQIVRDEFGRGNDFCQKITYRTTGVKPEDLLQQFRNSYMPRVVVTVDMIATGTDIKPLEIVMFMRAVRSRNYFEQMKGRGSRVIDATDFRQVSPDAQGKTHFMIVDCVGVTETNLTDTTPMDREPSVGFEKLLNQVAMGSTNPDTLSTLASRLARLDRRLDKAQQEEVKQASGGPTLKQIVVGLVRGIDPDAHLDAARAALPHPLPPDEDPPAAEVKKAAERLMAEAAKPLAASPPLRDLLVRLKSRTDQVIDGVSEDALIDHGHSPEARERAHKLVTSFQDFLERHKDDITALQILYSRPRRQRLRFQDLKALAQALRDAQPPMTPQQLWRAYETLERDRVRGAGAPRLLTDVVSLVKHAVGEEPDLVPFPQRVQERFERWMAQQEASGRAFTPEQVEWLVAIAEFLASNAEFDVEAFDYTPFNERGGLAKARRLFGEELGRVIEEMNEVLVG